MFVRIDQLTAPANTVVDVALVRQATRIDSDADDSLLAFYIGAATDAVQNYLNRSLITRTLVYTWAETRPPVAWPYTQIAAPILPFSLEYTAGFNSLAMTMPYGDVQAISNVVMADWQGNVTTLILGTDYTQDLPTNRICLQNQTIAWNSRAHISVTYTGGYGNTPASIPTPIIHGILMTVAGYYEHRGDSDLGKIPDAVYNKLSDYRSIMWPIR